MSAKERMAASEKGYENGLGAMSAEERMAVSVKDYENGLGAMSAEERMAASAKSMLEAGIAWEEKYDDLKSYNGMPEKGTPLHNWQKNQLRNGDFSLNAKIWKEIEENEGSFVWRERRVELADCVEQKNRAVIGHGIGGNDNPTMARLTKARRWSKR